MNTFSQSSEQKIPDCQDKSSSCLTDSWWDRFLDTKNTLDNWKWMWKDSSVSQVFHSNGAHLFFTCKWDSKPQKKKYKQNKTKENHLSSGEQALFVESFTDCWRCFMVTSLQTLIDALQIRITTHVFHHFIARSTNAPVWLNTYFWCQMFRNEMLNYQLGLKWFPTYHLKRCF